MEFIEFLKQISAPIDMVLIMLVILSGIFQKKYLQDLNFKGAWRTLLVSAVFTIIYGLLMMLAGKYTKDLPLKWFYSYVTATSLYQMFLEKFIGKFFPDQK